MHQTTHRPKIINKTNQKINYSKRPIRSTSTIDQYSYTHQLPSPYNSKIMLSLCRRLPRFLRTTGHQESGQFQHHWASHSLLEESVIVQSLRPIQDIVKMAHFQTVNLDICGLGGHTGNTGRNGELALGDFPDKPKRFPAWCVIPVV